MPLNAELNYDKCFLLPCHNVLARVKMTGHVEDYSILVYSNQQIYSGLQVLMLAHMGYSTPESWQ